MRTSRVLFALAGSLVSLLASDSSAYAEDLPPSIVAYQNKPANAFDVFMLAVNCRIAEDIHYRSQKCLVDGRSLEILERVTHSVPSEVMDEWRASPALGFIGFSYHEQTHSFTAKFIIFFAPHHPIYTTNLGPDGERKRARFLQKFVNDELLRILLTGISSSVDRHQSVNGFEANKLQADFMNDVAKRTKLVLHWSMDTERTRDMPTPPLLTQLSKQGVAIREYTVIASSLPLIPGQSEPSIETTFQDFESLEEMFRARSNGLLPGLEP